MEACGSYRPWHDKQSGKTFLRGSQSKCLHYYFYFIDPYLGFGYIRVPTWFPFKLQIYFNGHNVLANELDKQGIYINLFQNLFVFCITLTYKVLKKVKLRKNSKNQETTK